MEPLSVFARFLLAIALGALIGAERERFGKRRDELMFGGIRSFVFISLLGAIAAYLSSIYFEWFIVPIFLGLIILIGISYYGTIFLTKGRNIGITGEVAAVLAFLMGVLCFTETPILALGLTVIITAFLYFKERLHGLVNKVSREEMYSTLVFAIFAFVILPFLPNQTYGPFDVLNPYKIWLMVVFICGLSYVGYIAVKILGTNKGIGLTGLLGGMVSSTAITMSFAGQSKKETNKNIIRLLVFGTLIANAIMFVRVIIEVSVVNKSLLSSLLVPMIVMGVVALIAAWFLWLSANGKSENKKQDTDISKKSPFTFGPAIKFGILFGIVLFVVKVAQVYFGDTGVLIASIVSGFVDVDAITLSMASVAGTEVSAKVAVSAITLAVMSNTIIKFIYAGMFGSKSFRNKLGITFAFVVAAGLITILLV